MADYKIVYSGGSDEIVEKKSRFIANVFPVSEEEEVLQIIEDTRKKYWDARHNCYAYVIGSNDEITRCSDDGEPSGTAGRPILEVITGSGIHNALIIVTRYFGGTLLGTGGLVRAYSKSAQAGIAASKVVIRENGRKASIKTDYNGIGKIQYIAGNMELTTLDTDYSDIVKIELLVPEDKVETLVNKVTEASSGRALIDIGDELYFSVVDGVPVIL